jgi:hypothetical protein
VVDSETVEVGLEALGVAIATLLEDAHEAAVRTMPAGAAKRAKRIADLKAVGQDVAALAAAMEVLQRRRRTEAG